MYYKPVVIRHDEPFEAATLAALDRAHRISFRRALLGRESQTDALEDSLGFQDLCDPYDELVDLDSSIGRHPSSIEKLRMWEILYGPFGPPRRPESL